MAILEDLDIKSLEQKNNLNPKFWDKDKMLDKSIRNKLIKIALHFKNEMKLDINDIVDIIITGSIANYNWSKYSDIDLHLVLNFDKLNVEKDLLEDYFNAKKNLWNNLHNIKINGHEVEVYVQNSKEPHYSTGVYSLIRENWVTEPQIMSAKTFDKRSVSSKTKDIMKLIDFIDSKLTNEPLQAMKLSDILQDRLKNMRSAGLEKDGEYSVENLTYKLLRRVGYLDKLYDIENQAFDKLMSI